jgi:hypothetical protein
VVADPPSMSQTTTRRWRLEGIDHTLALKP